MTKERIRATDTGLPKGSMERLAQFAEWTRTTPPTKIVDGEGSDMTFSDEILIYANENGLDLDWFWLGDERGLVMAVHHQTRNELVPIPHMGVANDCTPEEWAEIMRQHGAVEASS